MPTLALMLALSGAAVAQEAALPAEAAVLDRVVAVVGDRVLTRSDERLERVLAERDPSPVPMLRRRQARAPLEMLVDAAVVRNLAGNIAIYAPSTSEVQQRLAALRATWADPDDWQRFLTLHGISEERLAGRLYARMVVEAYVFRSVGLAAQTNEDSPSQADARYLEWVTAERDRVDIRRVAPMEAP